MCQYKKEACFLKFLQIHVHTHIGHTEQASYSQQLLLEMHIKTFSLPCYHNLSFLSVHKNLFSACEHNITYLSKSMTECFYHITYTFQSESTHYSFLNVKELLARNSLSGSNRIPTNVVVSLSRVVVT